MNKKTIVLADNSYTIRRIVELSLSEENVELVSFENGLNLQEKLTELKPHVVLVDIKLPEMNGYEVCKFISEDENLNHTKVFLMKGGFDPLDENQIKNLQYEDIITKPFDSSTLISSIKKVLDSKTPQAAEEIPSSLPEDVPEIEDVRETSDEINFSDIKDEIDTNQVPREEVQPSEEVTQMAHGEKDDQLKPAFDEDDISNPFMDEAAAPLPAAQAPPTPIQAEPAEVPIPEPVQAETEPVEAPDEEPTSFIQNTMPEDELKTATEGVQEETPSTEDELDVPSVEEPVAGDLEDLIPDSPQVEEMPSLDEQPATKEEALEIIPDAPLTPQPPTDISAEPASEPSLLDEEPVPETIEPEPVEGEMQMEDQDTDSDLSGKIEIPEEEPQIELEIDQETSQPEPPLETQPEIVEPEPPAEPDIAEEGPQEIEKPTVETTTIESETASEGISMITKDEMLHKVEDKLTVAIKEVLWEVIPPLAEKIINEEIERIKSKIDQEAV